MNEPGQSSQIFSRNISDPVNDRPNEIWGNDQVMITRVRTVRKPGIVVVFWWMLRLWFERKFLGMERDRIN